MTLAELFLARAGEHAARPLLHDESGTATYADVLTDASRIAGSLLAAGIEPGAHVGILLPNGRPYVTALLGVVLAGAVAVPLDPRLRAPEIRFLVAHCRCRALLASAPATPPLDLGDCREIAYHDARLHPPTGPGSSRDPLDPAVILATSGSTAAPKAVVLSHRSLLTNQRSVGDLYGFGPDDVFLTALSLFHSFGLTACLLAAIDRGASVVTAPDVQPARLAVLAAHHGATVLFATAALYPYLVRGAAPPASFRTVRHFLSGAAPLAETTALAFRARFGQDIVQTYGLTEASPVVTANPPSDNRPGTVGPALPGVALRVVDDELQIQGKTVMIGYLDNPSATAACLGEDGWLATGDLARIEASGYVTLLGRKKDLILRGGEKIFPDEVEEALCRHPDVAEAAVVGLADPAFFEVPVAFIVPRRAGAALDVASLDAHCRRELAVFKIPRRYLAIDVLPRNPNGKLLKRELRQLLAGPPGSA
ncbi:MAG: class I adenylate-forming enzyme family protein [Byssovorax sp.]